MGRNRATLADVARKAGLSKTAASMVLNGREGTRLSAEAHQRVFAAAEELGYRPNLAARSLRTRKTATIAFVSDIVATTRFAGDLIRGALDAARERDHVLLITETQGDATFEQYAIEAVLDRQVDGVIYAAMATRRLTVPAAILGGPVVLLNATSPDGLPSVVPDDEGLAAPSPPPCWSLATATRSRSSAATDSRRTTRRSRSPPAPACTASARRWTRRTSTSWPSVSARSGCPSTGTPPCAAC